MADRMNLGLVNEDDIEEALSMFLGRLQELGEYQTVVGITRPHDERVFTAGLGNEPNSFVRLVASLVKAAANEFGWGDREIGAILHTIYEAISDGTVGQEYDSGPRLPLS